MLSVLLPFVVDPGPVDLRLKIVPLGEAVAALAGLGDLHLAVDPKVADRTITLLLRRADAREAMARIADVMRLRWEADGRTLRLTTDPAIEAATRAQTEAERAEGQREAEASLRGWAAETPADPTRVARSLRGGMDVLTARRLGDAGFAEAVRAFRQASREASWAGLGLRTLDAEGWRRLLAGDVLRFGTGDQPEARRLPDAALSHTPFLGEDLSRVFRITGTLGFRAESGALRVGTRVYFLDSHGRPPKDDSAGGGGKTFTMTPDPLLDPPRTPFAAETAAWSQGAPTGAGAAIRTRSDTPERPLDWAFQAPSLSAPRLTYPLSASDRLEWLHDATGVDVVAQADRRAALVGTRRFDGTIAEFVRKWRRDESPGATDAFRLVGRTLMFRPAASGTRMEEPSESVLRDFERKPPVLEDWADLAARLTEAQARDLAEGRMLLRRAATPLWQAGRLRFWSVLTLAQRTRARGPGLVAEDLAPSQRRAYVDLAISEEAMGFLPSETVRRIAAGRPEDVGFALSGDEAHGWLVRVGIHGNHAGIIPASR